MSTTNESTISGKMNEIAGKARQAFGEATGNDSEANKGAAQEVKGHAQQAWGSVKEAAQDTEDRNRPVAESHAQTLREDITDAAAKAKQHIENFADRHKS